LVGTLLGLTDAVEMREPAVAASEQSRWALISWTDRLSIALVLLSSSFLLFSVRIGPLYRHPSQSQSANDPAREQQQLGALAIRQGKFEDAVRYFTLAATLRPGDAQAHYDLGTALYRMNDWQAAAAAFEEALHLRPDLPHAHYALGAAMLSLHREDEAIPQFYAALQVNAHDADAHYELGRLLTSRGLVDEAIAEFEEVVRVEPQNGRGHYGLAMANWKASSSGANSLDDVRVHLARSGDELELAEELGADIDSAFAITVRQEIANRNKGL